MRKRAESILSRRAGNPFPDGDPGVLLKPKLVRLALRTGTDQSQVREPGGRGLPLAGVGQCRSQLGHCPPHRSGGSAPVWRTAGGSLGWGRGRTVRATLPNQLQRGTEDGASQASPSSFFVKALALAGCQSTPQRLCLHSEPYMSLTNLLCL